LELPNQWLWDIIDEFIYQFQSFCHYRAKLHPPTSSPSSASSHHTSSAVDISLVQSRPDVWNVLNVLNVLYSLIQKSHINEQLTAAQSHGGGRNDMIEAVAGDYGARPLYRMLGYFSLVGLVRVHVCLGDYAMALKTLEHVDLTKKGLFARVTACHVSTYYYVGFAYMMMRRYVDAAKAFAHVLLFVARTKQYHTRSYQYEVVE
jgi:translation initiation factor 3 subunit L